MKCTYVSWSTGTGTVSRLRMSVGRSVRWGRKEKKRKCQSYLKGVGVGVGVGARGEVDWLIEGCCCVMWGEKLKDQRWVWRLIMTKNSEADPLG